MDNQENKTPSTEPSETQKKSNKKKIIAAIAQEQKLLLLVMEQERFKPTLIRHTCSRTQHITLNSSNSHPLRI